MKIQLRQLVENPFRNLGEPYVIDSEKVENLCCSIRTTGFWDNLIVRRKTPTPQETSEAMRSDSSIGVFYEIAYGHHRLEALRVLVRQQLIDEYYELELPVRSLDDSAMIRIMAAENQINKQTVGVLLKYISDETRTPAAEVTAEDICQVTGGDWHDHRRTVAGMLKKIRQK